MINVHYAKRIRNPFTTSFSNADTPSSFGRNFNVWFQKISIPPSPPPQKGSGFPEWGGGGSICLIFQWGGGGHHREIFPEGSRDE